MPNKSYILLIEDNPDDEALTIRALKKNNISNDVIVIRDGPDAIDFILAQGHYSHRDRADLPVVILLDLKLPKINGLEVLRQIRHDPVAKLVPVVILTSSREEQDLISGYSNGANSYIRKPVDFEQFTEAIGHIGLYWLLLNEKPPGLKAGKTS